MPFATIVIPTYNQAQFLGQALDSLLAQTDQDWEAVVVNDGSTDNTAEIARAYVARDQRIRYIYQPNGGVAAALNTGLIHARGDWIHWLSSDDMFEPEKLAINRRWIAQNADTNFFFSYFTLLRESNGELDRRGLWGPLPDEDHQVMTLFYRNFVSGITICVRRSAWEEVGFFDTKLRYAQDYDQWLRILQKNKGKFIPEWTVVSRNHAAQGSETFPAACYFDTAKAAIRFLNDHTFAQLFPWSDLSDEVQATRAVTLTLDVACDRTSFVYCLGTTRALIGRLLEWAFSASCQWDSIRSHISNRIRQVAFDDGDDDWAWMWRHLALALSHEPADFQFSLVEPIQTARREWQSKAIRDEEDQNLLADYLRRFDGVNVSDDASESLSRARIVLQVDEYPSADDAIVAAAKSLEQRGYRSLIIARVAPGSHPVWQVMSETPLIALSQSDMDSLPWLGEIELAVVVGRAQGSPWLGSLMTCCIDEGLSAPEIEHQVIGALQKKSGSHKRKVIFLERVMWGGGAERVVLDVARHLDRKRFEPEIWTMFDEHVPSSAVRHVAHHRLRMPSGLLAQDGGKSNVISVPSSARRWAVNFARGAYHRLASPSFRRRLGLGSYLREARALSDPHLAKRLARSISDVVHRGYRNVTPLALRQRLGLGSRLVSLLNVERPHPSEPSDPLGSTSSVSAPSTPVLAAPGRPMVGFDFIGATTHHQPQALALAERMRYEPSDALLITVMEEATVAAWLAQAETARPYVASLHTVESKCLEDIYRHPQRLASERLLFGAACSVAQKIIFPTDGSRRDLIESFGADAQQIDVISNPIDCSRVRRQSFEEIPAVRAWRETSSGLRLVHVGRLDPQKNHALLLEACTTLKRKRLKFSLVLVGGGWAQATIEKQIADLGLQDEVHLVGEQANPFPWIAAADALVLTSNFEAFGLVLVEAMVCGTAVISVNCPVGPAEVLSGGEFGLLTTASSPEAVADAIETLMNDSKLRQNLISRGYDRALTFDIKAVVPLWEQVIEAVPPMAAE